MVIYGRFWVLACSFFLFVDDTLGQNCANRIKEDQIIGSLHFLSTQKFTLLKRADYSYEMELTSDGEGINALITSNRADRLDQGDEFIFQDNANKRLNFYFMNQLNRSNSGEGSSSNKIRLGFDDLKWIASGTINAFFIKKNELKEMKKFTLNSDNSNELVSSSNCFLNKMDISKVEQSSSKSRLITFQNKENSGQDNNKESGSFSKPGGPSGGSQGDQELTDLKKQLADLKQRLREEIRIETEKSEKVKGLLADEVTEARRKANEQKNTYSAEIVEARKKSLDEIEKIRKDQSGYLQTQKSNFSNENQRLDSALNARRLEIALEIDKARLQGDERILSIRQQTEKEVIEIQKSKAVFKQEYADEIAGARATANTELARIREETSEDLKKIQSLSSELKNKNATDVEFAQKTAGEKIRTVLQESTQKIHDIKEKNILEKERLATDLASIKLKSGEEVAKLSESQSRQISLLKENFEVEKSKIAKDIQLAREKGAEQVTVNNQNLEDTQKKQKDAVIKTKTQADSAMVAIKKQNELQQTAWSAQIEKQRKITDSIKANIVGEAVNARQKLNTQLDQQKKATDSVISILRNKEQIAMQRNATVLDSFRKKLMEEMSAQEKFILKRKEALNKAIDSSAMAYKRQIENSQQKAEVENRKIEEDRKNRVAELKKENRTPSGTTPQKEAEFSKEAAAEDIASARKDYTAKKLSLEKQLFEMQRQLNDSIFKTQMKGADRIKLLHETQNKEFQMLSETKSRKEDSLRQNISDMMIKQAEEVNGLKIDQLRISDSLTLVISSEKQRAQQEIMKNYEIAAEEVETIKVQKQEAIREEEQKYYTFRDSIQLLKNGELVKSNDELQKAIQENLKSKEKSVKEYEEVKAKLDKELAEERKRIESELNQEKRTIGDELKIAKQDASREMEATRLANLEKLEALYSKIKEAEGELKNIQEEIKKNKKN